MRWYIPCHYKLQACLFLCLAAVLPKCDADNWGLLCLAFLSVCVQSLIISDSALWKRAPLCGILAFLLLMLPTAETNGAYMFILV